MLSHVSIGRCKAPLFAALSDNACSISHTPATLLSVAIIRSGSPAQDRRPWIRHCEPSGQEAQVRQEALAEADPWIRHCEPSGQEAQVRREALGEADPWIRHCEPSGQEALDKTL
ncbi:hypothetical protein ACOMHN_009611 [Nucella lapillus]